jgi:glucose/arabinose dehydrogenase
MTVQQTLLAISALAIALIVASCGGGSGSSAPSPTPAPDPDPDPEPEPDAPFGLTVRQSLANFTLPVQSGAGNAFALQSAFPNQGFASPTYATGIPGENRIAVLERRGRIRAFTNERQSVGSRLIVDISGQIRSGGEQGLLGLAFDPAFAQNRYIYLN